MGVTEPQATFSPCFGGPFLVWHPTKYADLLAEKLRRHGSNVWLINTGWSGGGFGVGKRIPLTYTRAIIDAIHSGSLADAPTRPDPTFGFSVVTECPEVPSGLLLPRNTWPRPEDYDIAASGLAELFRENFRSYESDASEELLLAGPRVQGRS
jgi:phosphoenolpyruvate carboxykinase (ATP)